MRIPFTKMHGLGNDFVLIDCRDQSYCTDTLDMGLIANRRLGVGCDQILLLDQPRNKEASASYKVFNSDGSSAEQCGNGLRCVVQYLKLQGEIEATTVVEVGNELVEATACENGQVTVKMLPPDFSPTSIGLEVSQQDKNYSLKLAAEQLAFGAVSMGNPHAVIRVGSVNEASVSELGAAVQASGIFSNGVNVGFVEIVSDTRIHLRVHERGVGETPACGTGACAAVAVGILWGDLAPGKIDVRLPGGRLDIEWNGGLSSEIYMTGPAQFVFEGAISL
jgi:diaminopimelate epimerase